MTTRTFYCSYNKCAEVLDQDGSSVAVGSWVLARDSGGAVCVGHVAEILQVMDSAAAHEGRADLLLIEHHRLTGIAAPYGVPGLRFSAWKEINAQVRSLDVQLYSEVLTSLKQEVLCLVNVQHNCAAHACTDTGRAALYQERERATSKAVISHRDKGDLLLNTFQMRNSPLLQLFRQEPEALNRDESILLGAQAEVDSQHTQKVSTGKGKAPVMRMTALRGDRAAVSSSRLAQSTVASQD